MVLLYQALAKWLRLQRAQWCARRKRAPLLPITHEQARRPRVRLLALACAITIVGALFWRHGGPAHSYRVRARGGREAGGTGTALLLNTTKQPTVVLPRCAGGAAASVECGSNIVPAMLCAPALGSQILSRFTQLRTPPWNDSVRTRRRDNALRLLQYSWFAPAFGSSNSWEATRFQILAEVLLSKSDVVCLQGLASDQARWLNDAFDVQGYSGIISAGDAATNQVDAQEIHATTQARPNAATFWRKKYSLISSHLVSAGSKVARNSNTYTKNGASSASPPSSGGDVNVQQGALVVALNASTRVRGANVYYTVRVANTVVDAAAPPHVQILALSEILSQVAAPLAAARKGGGWGVGAEGGGLKEGGRGGLKDEATIVTGRNSQESAL